MLQAKVILIENFLSPQECDELSAWSDLAVQNGWLSFGHNTSTGDKTYAGRMTTRGYEDKFEFPALAHEVSARITARLGLTSFSKSDSSIITSSTLPGGSVIAHLDPKENNGEMHVLRCNVVTRAAEQGGELLIGGNKMSLKAGDLHCYLVSLLPHSVTKVEGSVSRVLWMFGYQMCEEDFNLIAKKVS